MIAIIVTITYNEPSTKYHDKLYAYFQHLEAMSQPLWWYTQVLVCHLTVSRANCRRTRTFNRWFFNQCMNKIVERWWDEWIERWWLWRNLSTEYSGEDIVHVWAPYAGPTMSWLQHTQTDKNSWPPPHLSFLSVSSFVHKMRVSMSSMETDVRTNCLAPEMDRWLLRTERMQSQNL